MAYRRIEVRIAEGDDLLAELASEAVRRGVTLPQHVYDLLRARYLARRGQTMGDLLWVPGEAVSEPVEEPPSSPASAAAGAASAWLGMVEE
jgi:hypothetical protein